jgi:hypothetical protein
MIVTSMNQIWLAIREERPWVDDRSKICSIVLIFTQSLDMRHIDGYVRPDEARMANMLNDAIKCCSGCTRTMTITKFDRKVLVYLYIRYKTWQNE